MADVKFMGESKLISLDDRSCTLTNGTKVACAHLKFCLSYDGINVDQQISECFIFLVLHIKFMFTSIVFNTKVYI